MAKPKLRSGRCQICRCTENRACSGGCYWVDDARTLCSACGCTELPAQRQLQDLLLMVGYRTELADVLCWRPITRARIQRWAAKEYLAAGDTPVRVPTMPRQVRQLKEVRL